MEFQGGFQRKPILLIHGDADAYVPLEECLKSYESKTKGYKHIWIPEGTTHAMAFNDYPQEYTDLMAAFLSEQIEK